MFNTVYYALYYTWLLVRYRGDLIALGNTFNSLFNNRKAITYHFYQIIRTAKVNIIDNYLM